MMFNSTQMEPIGRLYRLPIRSRHRPGGNEVRPGVNILRLFSFVTDDEAQ